MLCHDGEKINLPTCSFNSLGNKFILKGSGGSSVGRAIALNSRGPQFESSHRQKFILNIYCQLYWKDENKEKEAGNVPLKTLSTPKLFSGDQLSVDVPNTYHAEILACLNTTYKKFLK